MCSEHYGDLSPGEAIRGIAEEPYDLSGGFDSGASFEHQSPSICSQSKQCPAWWVSSFHLVFPLSVGIDEAGA